MCADAIRQPVMNGCDFDVGLRNAETALDIGQRLVMCDGFGGREIGCVGQQRQLSVKEFGMRDGLFIKVPAKTVSLQVRLDEPAQFRFGDGPGKSAIGPAVGGAPSASGLPFALSVELGNYFFRQAFQFPDTGTATICLLCQSAFKSNRLSAPPPPPVARIFTEWLAATLMPRFCMEEAAPWNMPREARRRRHGMSGMSVTAVSTVKCNTRPSSQSAPLPARDHGRR